MRLYGAETNNKQNKAQNVLEISRLGCLVIAYLGYNIPYGLEYPTLAIVPNLLKAFECDCLKKKDVVHFLLHWKCMNMIIFGLLVFYLS